MKLYVDDEPLLLATADLEAYERVARLPRRASLTRDLHVAHAGRQAGAGPLAAPGQPGPPPPGDADVRGHDARRARRRWSSRRSCSTARTARTSTTSPPPPSATASDPAQGARIRPPCARRPACTSTTTARCALGYRCANSGMTLACGYRHLVETAAPHRVETSVGARPRQDRHHGPGSAGRDDPGRKLVVVPHVDRRAGRGAGRPLSPHAGACRARRRRPAARRAAAVARRLLGAQRRRAARRRARPAGRAVEPVPARPGQRPDPRAGHRGQGR